MNTWDLLVSELLWLRADKKSWPLSQTEQKTCNFLFPVFSSLPAFHLPPCCSSIFSSLVKWGGGFSSLTNVVQIACRITMGEHLDLGHTLFVVAALPQSILVFFFHLTAALLQRFSQMKEQLPDPLFCLVSAVCILKTVWAYLQQDVVPVITVVNTCLISRLLAVIMHFSYHQEVFLQEIFLMFVCIFKTYLFPPVQTIRQRPLMGRGVCHYCVQLEVTQHAVVQ